MPRSTTSSPATRSNTPRSARATSVPRRLPRRSVRSWRSATSRPARAGQGADPAQHAAMAGLAGQRRAARAHFRARACVAVRARHRPRLRPVDGRHHRRRHRGHPDPHGRRAADDGEVDVYQVNLGLRQINLQVKPRRYRHRLQRQRARRRRRSQRQRARRMAQPPALRQVPPGRQQPAGRRRAGGPDRCLAEPRLQPRRTQDRGHRQGGRAVRQDPAQGHHQRGAHLGRRDHRRQRAGRSQQALRGGERPSPWNSATR